MLLPLAALAALGYDPRVTNTNTLVLSNGGRLVLENLGALNDHALSVELDLLCLCPGGC